MSARRLASAPPAIQMVSVIAIRQVLMAIKVEKLERIFLFGSARLPDPNSDFTVEQVRTLYLTTYPELATAAIEGPSTVNGTLQYTFTRAVGAKG
jgi:PRTRC genetic system protein C